MMLRLLWPFSTRPLLSYVTVLFASNTTLSFSFTPSPHPNVTSACRDVNVPFLMSLANDPKDQHVIVPFGLTSPVGYIHTSWWAVDMESSRLNVIHGHLRHHAVVPEPVASSRYQYTTDGAGILTDEQRRFYEENGFVVIKKLIPPNEIEMYKHRFMEICKRQVKIPGITIMKDVSIANSEHVPGEQAITKIQDFYNDPVLFSYCHNPRIHQYIESITGPNVMAVHSMLINKPPDTGKKTSRHPLHQDLHYFIFRPAEKIVASWTAMQRVDRSNGCLVVQPGSHKGTLKEHGYPNWEGGVNKLYHGIMDYDDKAPRVHLEMEEGDTVFFHPLLIHGSGTNVTNGFRKAISCHFASSDCYYIKAEGTTHETAEKEVLSVAKRKLGPDVQVSWEDISRTRFQLVKGERHNL